MISIKYDSVTTTWHVVGHSGQCVAIFETQREAKSFAAALRRTIARDQPKPLYTIWQYTHRLPVVNGYEGMGLGWAYRIINTGERKSGFATETIARTNAEWRVRRT